MQLSSTLFAIAVVQIKPQLEKLLNLPNDSLTKEIQLTQDLMKLFIKYQIPSDLISYDQNNVVNYATSESKMDEGIVTNGNANIALNQVKGHVEKMNNMIADLKEQDIKRKAEVAIAATLDRQSYKKQKVRARGRRSKIESSDDEDEEEDFIQESGMHGMAMGAAFGGGGRMNMRGGPPPPPQAAMMKRGQGQDGGLFGGAATMKGGQGQGGGLWVAPTRMLAKVATRRVKLARIYNRVIWTIITRASKTIQPMLKIIHYCHHYLKRDVLKLIQQQNYDQQLSKLVVVGKRITRINFISTCKYYSIRFANKGRKK